MTPQYRIEYSNRAQADLLQLGLNRIRNGDEIEKWLANLTEQVETLSSAPHLHPIAREQPLFAGQVRRMLYYGPGGRRGKNRPAWRILYTIREPDGDEAEGVVSLVRVLHSGQDILFPATEEEN